jgi:hypothetical protein
MLKKSFAAVLTLLQLSSGGLQPFSSATDSLSLLPSGQSSTLFQEQTLSVYSKFIHAPGPFRRWDTYAVINQGIRHPTPPAQFPSASPASNFSMSVRKQILAGLLTAVFFGHIACGGNSSTGPSTNPNPNPTPTTPVVTKVLVELNGDLKRGQTFNLGPIEVTAADSNKPYEVRLTAVAPADAALDMGLAIRNVDPISGQAIYQVLTGNLVHVSQANPQSNKGPSIPAFIYYVQITNPTTDLTYTIKFQFLSAIPQITGALLNIPQLEFFRRPFLPASSGMTPRAAILGRSA